MRVDKWYINAARGPSNFLKATFGCTLAIFWRRFRLQMHIADIDPLSYKWILRILTHFDTNGHYGYWPTFIQNGYCGYWPTFNVIQGQRYCILFQDAVTWSWTSIFVFVFGSLRSFLGQHPDDALERDRLRSRRSNASRGTSLGQQQSWWVIIRSRGFAVGDVGKCVCLHS